MIGGRALAWLFGEDHTPPARLSKAESSLAERKPKRRTSLPESQVEAHKKPGRMDTAPVWIV